MILESFGSLMRPQFGVTYAPCYSWWASFLEVLLLPHILKAQRKDHPSSAIHHVYPFQQDVLLPLQLCNQHF
uniref:Uncharacterized protein n=1 Tax=Arundo donax TaxID=35708 RepID=A0A0A9G7P1_ARUDO